MFFVSADSKEVSDSVSLLFATHARWSVSVADKGVTEIVSSGWGAVRRGWVRDISED